jgi:hypothetical protein
VPWGYMAFPPPQLSIGNIGCHRRRPRLERDPPLRQQLDISMATGVCKRMRSHERRRGPACLGRITHNMWIMRPNVSVAWACILGSAGAPLFCCRRRRPPPAAAPSLACLPADEAPVIRPGVLSQESRTALKAAYEGAQPFPHSAIHDLCDPQLLRQVCCWHRHRRHCPHRCHGTTTTAMDIASASPAVSAAQAPWRCTIQSVCGRA